MPYKIGGGGLPELYDPENGQYTNEEKQKLLEIEITNIKERYLSGNKKTFKPRFPILDFHSDEYCEFFVKYGIYELNRYLPYKKIEYLLKHSSEDDKSHFFNMYGYTSDEKGRNELFMQIMKHSDFGNMKFQKFNEYGVFVKVPTSMYNKKEGNFIYFTTIRKLEEDMIFHFVTAIPRKMED